MNKCSKTYNKYKDFPLRMTIIYYIATYLLSIIGPIKYFNGEYKYWIVFPFMIGVCLSLFFGYYIGKYARPKTYTFFSDNYIASKEQKLLKRALIISIVSLIIEFCYVIAIGHFSFSLASLGNLYNTKIEDNSNTVILIRFICSPFRMIANSLGIYKYKECGKPMRKLIILNVLLYILIFLFGYGNQKGTSDIIIYFVVAIFVRRVKSGKQTGKNEIRIIIFALIVALFLFSYMQYLRYEPMGINASNFHLYSSGEYYFNTKHLIFKIFGDKLGFGMSSILSGYLSQGYYGLSLCMQLPFQWTYGIGSSYALSKLLSKVGITGIYERTYLNRMTENFGRNGLRTWNTIFPWLASDYTWIGAMLFFVFVGYFFSKAWKEVIENDNNISYLVVVNSTVLVLFTPANNQLFHGYDLFIATWFLVLIWLFFRGRYMHEQ